MTTKVDSMGTYSGSGVRHYTGAKVVKKGKISFLSGDASCRKTRNNREKKGDQKEFSKTSGDKDRLYYKKIKVCFEHAYWDS